MANVFDSDFDSDPDEVFGFFRRQHEVDYWEGEPRPERPDGGG